MRHSDFLTRSRGGRGALRALRMVRTPLQVLFSFESFSNSVFECGEPSASSAAPREKSGACLRNDVVTDETM